MNNNNNEKIDKTKRLGVIHDENIGQFKQLTWTALLILYAYFNDELILIVIHGKQGYGKSTLASIVSAQCYGILKKLNEDQDLQEQLKNKTESKQRRIKIKWMEQKIKENDTFQYDWSTTKNFFIFKPYDFICKAVDIKEKKPLCVVDDAGMWLNAMDYQDKFVRAVGKFFEVARTKYGAIVFTCSDLKQIFTKIRNMPHVYTIRIIKEGTGSKGRNPDLRVGLIHEGWESEDLKRSGRTVLLFDGFVAEMPEPFYRWYKPIRKDLAAEGINQMFAEFEKLKNS
jgi:hypothetical protein